MAQAKEPVLMVCTSRRHCDKELFSQECTYSFATQQSATGQLLYRVWIAESMLAFGSITQDAAVSRNAKLLLH